MRSDFELLDAWRDGDRRAGDELLSRYIAGIGRFLYGKAPADVDDLVQRTFTACVEGRDRLREDGSFRAYLYATARNVLHRHYRQRERLDRRHAQAALEGEAATTPSGVIARAEEERLLLAALRRLPLDLQITLEMTYWEDLTMRELAEVLQIPPGTVASRLRRAKEHLAAEVRQLEASKALIESTLTDLDGWARKLHARARGTEKKP